MVDSDDDEDEDDDLMDPNSAFVQLEEYKNLKMKIAYDQDPLK